MRSSGPWAMNVTLCLSCVFIILLLFLICCCGDTISMLPALGCVPRFFSPCVQFYFGGVKGIVLARLILDTLMQPGDRHSGLPQYGSSYSWIAEFFCLLVLRHLLHVVYKMIQLLNISHVLLLLGRTLKRERGHCPSHFTSPLIFAESLFCPVVETVAALIDLQNALLLI